jgi:hypothetical protein
VSILKIVDLKEEFVVCMDVCKEGLDGFLTQKDHVVCYESWKLKEHRRNYVTHDLELVAIIHALNMWRHYLMGE